MSSSYFNYRINAIWNKVAFYNNIEYSKKIIKHQPMLFFTTTEHFSLSSTCTTSDEGLLNTTSNKSCLQSRGSWGIFTSTCEVFSPSSNVSMPLRLAYGESGWSSPTIVLHGIFTLPTRCSLLCFKWLLKVWARFEFRNFH